jgi:hypothetical protein
MENKKLHNPAKHGLSNHCVNHDASSGDVLLVHVVPRVGQAAMEDVVEEGTGTALVGVSVASLLLTPPVSWVVRVVQYQRLGVVGAGPGPSQTAPKGLQNDNDLRECE